MIFTTNTLGTVGAAAASILAVGYWIWKRANNNNDSATSKKQGNNPPEGANLLLSGQPFQRVS
jgi:hypothetical protein